MTDGTVVQPVLDLTVSQGGDIDFGCFASGAGVFALGTDPLLAANPNLSYIRQTGAFVRVLNGGKNMFVTSVGLDDVSYPTDLYLGTVNGVYTAPVTSVTSLIGSGNTLTVTSAPLPLTSGHPFRKVAAIVDTGSGNTSLRGIEQQSDRGYLLRWNYGQSVLLSSSGGYSGDSKLHLDRL